MRLKDIFVGDSVPRLKDTREIAAEMEFIYPAMFRDGDGLASHIIDRLRSRKKGVSQKNVNFTAKCDKLTEHSLPIYMRNMEEQKETSYIVQIADGYNEKLLKSTPHTNPNWLRDLRNNFKSKIIDGCAINVQLAVKSNEVIEDLRERRETRNTIINSVVNYLVNIFDGVSNPRLGDVMELAVELQFVYPAMFKDSDPGPGYKGCAGVKGLASSIVDRVRQRLGKNKVVTGKKGKRKLVYGVNNDLWYNAVTPSTTFKHILFGQSYSAREKIFDANRSEVTALFRDHRGAIPRVCGGFFSDYRHLENQFKFLTSTEGLTSLVEENFCQEIENLESYLAYSRTGELPEYGEGTPAVVRHLDILRRAGNHFDQTGASLVRLETDGPSSNDDPFILAVFSNRSDVSCELWVCGSMILSCLSIAQAIAAFLHLAFVCNLQYPKGSQTLADILQRRFGQYGDYSGTRTHSRPDAARTKINKYLTTLTNIRSTADLL